MRKGRYKKIRLYSLLLVLCFVWNGQTVLASDTAVLQEQKGELSFILKEPGSENAIENASLILYQAGEVSDYQNAVFALTAAFAECGLDLNGMTTEKSIEYAKTLSNYAVQKNITGITAVTDKNGKAEFSALNPGIYLAVLKDENISFTMKPFLVTLPMRTESGTWNYTVEALPKLQKKDAPQTPPSETDKEDKPKETEKKPKSSKTPAAKTKLPQTGQLWWPVPFLAVGGLLLFVLGYCMQRRKSDDET